jgi:hypothetical protein
MRQIMPSQHKDKRRVGLAPPFFIAVAYCVIIFMFVTLSGGCSATSKRRRLSFEQRLSAPYDQTTIKQSLTLDVLPMIQRSPDEIRPGYDGTELLSKGLNVVAALGQDKDGYQTWYNMFAFHEYRLNVIRKYFFFVDDRPGMFVTGRGRGLRFDCEQILSQEMLGGTYAAESDRQAAILRYVLENLRKDIDELGADVEKPGQNNKMLDVSGMLMNQTFEMIFLRLESSPMLAGRLSQDSGIEFEHRSFDKGKVQMVVENDVVKIKIRVGEVARWMGFKQKKSRPVSRVLSPHR